MKIVTGKTGLILRLGMTAIVLLLGQQAMAVGTDAGTFIDNTVDVDYEVNSIPQTTLSQSVSFVVDRRVDFTLTQMGGALVPVTPGDPTSYFFDLLLTNTSNSALDFRLVLDDTITSVRGFTPDASLINIEYAVSLDIQSASDPDPDKGDPQFVDELPEDESIRIRVWGDAPSTLQDGEIDGVQITATAAEPVTAGLGADLIEAANTPGGVENVFADDAPGAPNGDGVEFESDGFLVVTADLAVTKSHSVFDDPLGSGLAIPGATIEYTILVVNNSATPAEDVVITDSIDTDVTLDLNVADYGGEDISVVNGVTTLTCNVESNVDGDGCDLVGQDLTITDLGEVSITVAGNSTLTIQYRVTIPTP